jgi:hypothetical protein
MESFPTVWILAIACLVGFFISYYVGALGLVLFAFLAVFFAFLSGWWENLTFWANAGTAFLVSAVLQLGYLLGLLSANLCRRATAFLRMKQEKASAAVAEASLSKMPEGNAP